MNLYFSNTVDQDPTNSSNWWDAPGGSGGGGTNGYTPSVFDDCYIDAGQICSTSAFNYLSLTNDGTITTNDSTKTINANNNTGTVVDNYGTVMSNSGVVSTNKSYSYVTTNNGTVSTNETYATVTDNFGNVGANNGTILTRYSGGSTTFENQIADIPSGYTVTNLLVAIDYNNGNIGTVVAGSGGVGTNNGSILTNNGTVSTNSGNIVQNSSIIGTNAGVVTTNQSSGTVFANSGEIYTNNGTCRIGVIGGGTGNISASSPTNLSSHTAGTNVTFPTTPINWW